MLYYLSKFDHVWGPLRLFQSHLTLIGLGMVLTSLIVWLVLPRLTHILPTDRGKEFTPDGEKSKGKPQGAGVIFITIFALVCLLVIPPSIRIYQVLGCIYLAMLTGYFDDKSDLPWGQLLKGSLDFILAVLTAAAICQLESVTVWVPFSKLFFSCPAWGFILISAPLLWLMINSTNCSDGVDGLAGILTLLPLLFLGAFLYAIVGHVNFSEYLLVPHNPSGAHWAIMMLSLAGAISGYLWFNAEPSHLLMGDAGSRAIGLALGVGVLATGNFFLVFVVAPVILINGGAGMVKIVLLRLLKKAGVCTEKKDDAKIYIKLIHRYRFPLHDHCKTEMKWSGNQVVMRFAMIQVWLLLILFTALIKMR